MPQAGLLAGGFFDVCGAPSDVTFLGVEVGVVARVRLQVVRMERFLPRIGQLATRGPPFVGRLEVDGMVWDCRATEVDLSISLAEERAWLRCALTVTLVVAVASG